MSGENVTVVVRVEPRNEKKIVKVDTNKIIIKAPDLTDQIFTFDQEDNSVLTNNEEQEHVLKSLGNKILENVFQGYNTCILTYGYSWSGKSFSMMGTDDQPGLIPRICSALLTHKSDGRKTLQMEVSYMKLSNNESRDLFQPMESQKALEVLDHGSFHPYVEGLSQYAISNHEDIKLLIGENCTSEKVKKCVKKIHSPTIFTITVTVTNGSHVSEDLFSKVILVDLADKETDCKLEQKENEIIPIKALESVVSSLTEKSEQNKKHRFVPYEDSVLTRLLQNCLGGNCKTFLLVTISPDENNYQETHSTLMIASKVQNIENTPMVNKKNKFIQKLEENVKKLKEELKSCEKQLKDMTCTWKEKLEKTKATLHERQSGQYTSKPAMPEEKNGQSSKPSMKTTGQPSGSMSGEESTTTLSRTSKDQNMSELLPATSKYKAIHKDTSVNKKMLVKDQGTENKSSTHQNITNRRTLSRSDTGVNLGIFSWDTDPDVVSPAINLWKDNMNSKLSSLSWVPLSKDSEDEMKSAAKRFSFIICYYSKQTEKSNNDMESYLKDLVAMHGTNVWLMIDEWKHTNTHKERIHWHVSDCSSNELKIFTNGGEDVPDSSGQMLENIIEEDTVKELRDILTQTTENKLRAKGKGRKLTIGIFSRSAHEHYDWLQKLLISETFKDLVENALNHYFSNTGQQKFEDKVAQCTFGILYHSMAHGTINITDVENSLYDRELKELSTNLGRENVIVVIDDLENCSKDVKSKIVQSQPSIGKLAKMLLIFSKGKNKSHMWKNQSYKHEENKGRENFRIQQNPSTNKRDFQEHVNGNGPEISDNQRQKSFKQDEHKETFTKKTEKKMIGIFSRSAEDNYKWLQNLLKSEDFRSLVHDVRPFYISEKKVQKFREEVSKCKFGILYHTINQGRLNITDVTDSMYDKELDYLSSVLGRDHVIVVIDDLKDSSDKEKDQILREQFSIKTRACELILFSQEEKAAYMKNSTTAQGENLKKIRTIKQLMG